MEGKPVNFLSARTLLPSSVLAKNEPNLEQDFFFFFGKLEQVLEHEAHQAKSADKYKHIVHK